MKNNITLPSPMLPISFTSCTKGAGSNLVLDMCSDQVDPPLREGGCEKVASIHQQGVCHWCWLSNSPPPSQEQGRSLGPPL